MVTIDTPNNLGKTAFRFFLYSRLIPAFGCLLIAIVIAILGKTLATSIVDMLSMAGFAHASTYTVVSSVISNTIFALIALAIIIFMVAFVKSTLEYRNFSFTLEEFNLKVRRGILSTTEMSVPYRQMHDVSIERSINHKMFGISRLVIANSTDPESGNRMAAGKIILEPMDALLADEVRQIIERKIGVQVVERSADEKIESGATPATHL